MTKLLMMCCLVLVTGCAASRTVIEIPADRYVHTVRAGVPFTPAVDGKFVPQAQYNDMQDAYLRESRR